MQLPVSGAAARILPPAEFLHEQLGALSRAENFGCYADTGDRWLADPRGIDTFSTNGQYAVECDRLAGRDVAVIEIQNLSLFNFDLSRAVGDDGVHAILTRWNNQ